MPVFDGRIDDRGGIRMPFRLTQRPHVTGTAILSTSTPGVFVSTDWARRAGLRVVRDAHVDVEGAERRTATPASTHIDIELLARSDETWRVHGDAVVLEIEHGEVMVGIESLRRGILVVDGTARTWTLTIDPEPERPSH